MAEVIVALDLADADEALALVDGLPRLRWVKVGPMLFVRAGPALLRELKARDLGVFLDLKWHDIPHTVAEAVRAAAALGVDLVTVHALGGREMLEAAVEAARDVRVAAVTVLTSHTPRSFGVALGRASPDADLTAEVERLATLAVEAGVHGIVASPQETRAVRRLAGGGQWIIVPGVRPPGTSADDQRRIADPRRTVQAGATHLVVGRPIIRAERPRAVYEELCEICEQPVA